MENSHLKECQIERVVMFGVVPFWWCLVSCLSGSIWCGDLVVILGVVTDSLLMFGVVSGDATPCRMISGYTTPCRMTGVTLHS